MFSLGWSVTNIILRVYIISVSLLTICVEWIRLKICIIFTVRVKLKAVISIMPVFITKIAKLSKFFAVIFNMPMFLTVVAELSIIWHRSVFIYYFGAISNVVTHIMAVVSFHVIRVAFYMTDFNLWSFIWNTIFSFKLLLFGL